MRYLFLYAPIIWMWAWTDSQAFTGGNYFHLAKSILLVFVVLAIVLSDTENIRQKIFAGLIFPLMHFATFDYMYNHLAGHTWDYKLTLGFLGRFHPLAVTVAVVLAIILAVLYEKDRTYNKYHTR